MFYYSYSDSENYTVIQKFEWGEERQVPKNYDELAIWIAAGNTPDKVAGNRFVTITNGAISYDAAAKAAYDRELKILSLENEYNQQLAQVSQAYMAALILGDETTTKENRTAYQELLTEYNAKLEAIS
jgi:hypothetical protein